MSIAVIAGLGNPGSEYANTRHNIGFEVLDNLACFYRADWKKDAKHEAHVAKVTHGESSIFLLKPQTYMNESGRSIGPFCRYNKVKPDQVIVVYDDIGLSCARTKLSIFGSSGGHNGIESLFQHLGAGFIRYRIGIGAKTNSSIELKHYVLAPFSRYERQLMDYRMTEFLSELQLIIDKGVVHGMNHINKKEKNDKPETITDESNNDKKTV